MPVLRDFKCDDCAHEFESQEDKPLCPRNLAFDLNPGRLIMPGETCGGLTHPLPVGTKSYTIKGDNSASVTPKKHR